MPSNSSKNSRILVSFIIPVLNSAKVIIPCLDSIVSQKVIKYEIIITDGGSTDHISKVLKKYPVRIIKNSLQTGEAGKAIGLQHARGQYIALIDSDNILPSPNWLRQMVTPLESDPSLVGSEPLYFTYRPQAGFIERYSALIGANDPYAFFTGVYDKFSYLTNKWTGLPADFQDFPNYLKIKISPHRQLPTFGANGTVFRLDFLRSQKIGNYLFDIDILSSIKKPVYLAKTKNSIIHTYCENSISKFIRKQRRRISDLFCFQNLRTYSWSRKISFANVFFGLYSLSIIFPLIDSLRGFVKKPDPAWFFHPLACLLTFFIYTSGYLLHLANPKPKLNRSQWSQ